MPKKNVESMSIDGPGSWPYKVMETMMEKSYASCRFIHTFAISHAELGCRSLHSLSFFSTCQVRSLRRRLTLLYQRTAHIKCYRDTKTERLNV